MSTGVSFQNELMANVAMVQVGHRVLVKRKSRVGDWSLIQVGRIVDIQGNNGSKVAYVYLNSEETVKIRI